ncbi:MAG TPA: tetratricopeptide repeat protein [Rhizomicrobium sp.]
MSRTARYKIVYFTMLFGGAVLAGAAFVVFRLSPLAVVTVLIGALIPGRILGFFWRDLLKGLRLLNAREYPESKRSSERFLVEVHKRPWIRKLIWLGASTYSRDPEVIALNNLGAAEMQLGEHDAARRHLNQAIALDPLCPLPFVTLGIMARQAGDSAEAARCFAEARRLGYAHGLLDRIVRASQTRFAETDGR